MQNPKADTATFLTMEILTKNHLTAFLPRLTAFFCVRVLNDQYDPLFFLNVGALTCEPAPANTDSSYLFILVVLFFSSS